MVERTISPSFGTFQWEEDRPLFVTDDGGITTEDTGTPLLRRKTNAQAIGRHSLSAFRGSTVLLPKSVADEWDGRGVFVEDAAPTTLASSEERALDPFSVEWLEASTADVILDAVAGDPDMARSMASIEEGRAKPRTTLVAKLRKVKKD